MRLKTSPSTERKEEKKTKTEIGCKEDIGAGLMEDNESDSENEEECESKREKTRRVSKLMKEYFGECETEEEAIDSLIAECFLEYDRAVGEDSAIEWSKDCLSSDCLWDMIVEANILAEVVRR